MHMADALLTPAVGGTMWVASAGAIACSSAVLRRERDDRKAPLMGVLGAFLFAAQMINFTIPGTGSSGHLSGGLLLAILLGPSAAFLTIASVLVVQAFFFADGGLLALGCNIFNLGIIPAFVVFPLVYRTVIGRDPSRARLGVGTMAAALATLQLGSLAVVLETASSGISSLPLADFLMLIQPIHLAIGLVEGGVTIAVLSFVRKARPELLQSGGGVDPSAGRSLVPVLLGFLVCAVVIAGGLSLYASGKPDGLEWAVAKVSGKAVLPAPEQGVHGALSWLQQKTAWFADYRFKGGKTEIGAPAKLDTGVTGIVGAVLTLLSILCAAFLLRKGSRGAVAPEA
ncbi:MAG TPA: cobalamin biosynthesis protein CbiM [Geobacter sp.]|nr:cobalamin biosynthesis protein CbiM [Geobacter sp.]